MTKQQPQPGMQYWLFSPKTGEPVNLNNPGPDFLKPRTYRYRPKKKENPCGCVNNHTGHNPQPCANKIGEK